MCLLAATMLISTVCFVLTILMNPELVREAGKEQPVKTCLMAVC